MMKSVTEVSTSNLVKEYKRLGEILEMEKDPSISAAVRASAPRLRAQRSGIMAEIVRRGEFDAFDE